MENFAITTALCLTVLMTAGLVMAILERMLDKFIASVERVHKMNHPVIVHPSDGERPEPPWRLKRNP